MNPSLRRRRSTANGESPANSHRVTEDFKAMGLNEVTVVVMIKESLIPGVIQCFEIKKQSARETEK